MASRKISTGETARLCNRTAYTLRLWRHQGKGPRYYKLGEAQQAPVIYDEDEVIAWLEARKFKSTSDATVNHPGNA